MLIYTRTQYCRPTGAITCVCKLAKSYSVAAVWKHSPLPFPAYLTPGVWNSKETFIGLHIVRVTIVLFNISQQQSGKITNKLYKITAKLQKTTLSEEKSNLLAS